VCTSEELSDLPRRVKLLCEELVIFRDKKGRIRGDASGPVRL
jgi:phenylpropionate dioxygenase-like ring-hydroxylating dioxygenase large terminal subunit